MDFLEFLEGFRKYDNGLVEAISLGWSSIDENPSNSIKINQNNQWIDTYQLEKYFSERFL